MDVAALIVLVGAAFIFVFVEPATRFAWALIAVGLIFQWTHLTHTHIHA